MVLLPAMQQLMEGRYIFYSQDFTVMGGSLGEMHAKDHQNYDMAMKTGCPIICTMIPAARELKALMP